MKKRSIPPDEPITRTSAGSDTINRALDELLELLPSFQREEALAAFDRAVSSLAVSKDWYKNGEDLTRLKHLRNRWLSQCSHLQRDRKVSPDTVHSLLHAATRSFLLPRMPAAYSLYISINQTDPQFLVLDMETNTPVAWFAARPHFDDWTTFGSQVMYFGLPPLPEQTKLVLSPLRLAVPGVDVPDRFDGIAKTFLLWDGESGHASPVPQIKVPTISELCHFSTYLECVGNFEINDLEQRIYTLVAHSCESGIIMSDEAVRFGHFETYILPYLGGKYGCLNLYFHKRLHDEVRDEEDDLFGADWDVSLQEVALASKDWLNVTIRILHRALISGCISSIETDQLAASPALPVMADLTLEEFMEAGDEEAQSWSHAVWKLTHTEPDPQSFIAILNSGTGPMAFPSFLELSAEIDWENLRASVYETPLFRVKGQVVAARLYPDMDVCHYFIAQTFESKFDDDMLQDLIRHCSNLEVVVLLFHVATLGLDCAGRIRVAIRNFYWPYLNDSLDDQLSAEAFSSRELHFSITNAQSIDEFIELYEEQFEGQLAFQRVRRAARLIESQELNQLGKLLDHLAVLDQRLVEAMREYLLECAAENFCSRSLANNVRDHFRFCMVSQYEAV